MLPRALKEVNLHTLYADLEQPLVPVLATMERHGIRVDPARLADFSKELDLALERLTREIYERAGEEAKPRHLDYTIANQAEMILSFLKQLEIDRAVFLGSSYGAAIAATIALDHPTLVEKLIMVGAVNNNKPTRYLLMRLFGSPIIGDILSPLLVGSRRLLRLRMKRVYDRHSWVLDERRVDARHLPLRTRGAHRAIIRTVRRWDAERVSRDAHLLTPPTLLLWGDTDKEVPLQDGERLHESIPGSRLIVFRECGHLPQEEYPTEFVKVVSEFCS